MFRSFQMELLFYYTEVSAITQDFVCSSSGEENQLGEKG
jgi:hypothetical protein